MVGGTVRRGANRRRRVLFTGLALCAVLIVLLLTIPQRGTPPMDAGVSLSARAAPSGTEIILSLVTGDGSPIEGAEVRVEGTFSHHDHSDHSKPVREQRVSTRVRELGEGRYLVEGLEAGDGGEGALEATAVLPDGGTLTRAFVIPLAGSETHAGSLP